MTEILAFLNANSGAFNVLFSAVVAAATVVYAVLTAKLVAETRSLRAAATEPALGVTYRARDEAMGLLELVVTNIGSGPATRISFNYSAAPEGVGASELMAPLKKMKFLSSGINLLMPGQEFRAYWTDVRKNLDDKLKTTVTFRTNCFGASGVQYTREHLIDLSELEGVARLGTPPLLAMARSLEKMQSDLGHLATGFRRLRVDVYSEEDRAREEEEWHAQREECETQPTEKAPNSNGI